MCVYMCVCVVGESKAGGFVGICCKWGGERWSGEERGNMELLYVLWRRDHKHPVGMCACMCVDEYMCVCMLEEVG